MITREAQDLIRNLIIELSGAPDGAIDGAGSDGGELEFTLQEIRQGFNFLEQKLDRVARKLGRARKRITFLNDELRRPGSGHGHW